MRVIRCGAVLCLAGALVTGMPARADAQEAPAAEATPAAPGAAPSVTSPAAPSAVSPTASATAAPSAASPTAPATAAPSAASPTAPATAAPSAASPTAPATAAPPAAFPTAPATAAPSAAFPTAPPAASPTQSPTAPQTAQPGSAARSPGTDLNVALTRLIRAMNFSRLMTIGMDRAFARMPDRIGPIPKDKLRACTHDKLTPDILEQVVRPAFAMTFTDPALMDQLSAVFESSFGARMIELVIENKPIDPASFTPDEIAAMNHYAESPAIAAFLRDNGFARLMKMIYPYVLTAGAQARDACLRELLPRQVPVTNPRPA